MIDTKVVGMNWIEVPAGSYTLIPEDKKKSHCQIELSVRLVLSMHVLSRILKLVGSWDRFISHTPEGQWQKIAPLRILSFDIECAGRKGVFPEAQIDPVIQVASMVTRQGWCFTALRPCFVNHSPGSLRGEQTLYPECLHPQYLFSHRWLASPKLR